MNVTRNGTLKITIWCSLTQTITHEISSISANAEPFPNKEHYFIHEYSTRSNWQALCILFLLLLLIVVVVVTVASSLDTSLLRLLLLLLLMSLFFFPYTLNQNDENIPHGIRLNGMVLNYISMGYITQANRYDSNYS